MWFGIGMVVGAVALMVSKEIIHYFRPAWDEEHAAQIAFAFVVALFVLVILVMAFFNI